MPAKKAPDKTELTTEITEPTAAVDFLPNPDVLARYEKIIPGGAERILEIGEQRAAHEQLMSERTLQSTTRTCRIEQVITLILALGAGILGGALLLQGSELAGLLIILIDAAALVGVTIYGKNQP